MCVSQQVRNCRLSGLLDLALEKDYVRTKVADYMNHLIDIGVAGFRLDAAKHMWPGDIKAVLDKLHNLNTKWFSQGSRPFIFQEVDQYIIFKISSSSWAVVAHTFNPSTWEAKVGRSLSLSVAWTLNVRSFVCLFVCLFLSSFPRI